MDTTALRWFQNVADGVTVTEISEIERVTQSGVSRALARLSREVGTPLFRRSGRTLRPTQAGAAFKRHVDAMLHQLDDGLAEVGQIVAPDSGTVAIAFQLSLGTWLVPDLVATFRRAHPDVRFALRQVRDELVAPVLDGGGVDLQITTVRPTEPGVRWHHLLIEPLRLAVPRGHRLAGRGHISLHDAADEAFVTLQPTSLLRAVCESLSEQAGFTPRFVFECEDVPTVLGFVAADLGVALVPAPPARLAANAAVHYVAIDDPGAQREVGLAWSSEHRLLPAAELFRRHVIATARASLNGGPPTPVSPAQVSRTPVS